MPPDLQRNTLAERLKWARETIARVSQEELARRAGVSQGTIGNIESGTRRAPRDLLEIAKAAGVSAEWLKYGRGPIRVGHYGPQQQSIDAISIRDALPVVLEAMRACPHRDELRTLMALIIDVDAEPYRKRLAELLEPAPRIPKGLTETNDFAGKPPAQADGHHDSNRPGAARHRNPGR